MQEFTQLETQKPFYVRFSLCKTCHHLLRIIDRPFLENTPTADNLITVSRSVFFTWMVIHMHTLVRHITKTVNAFLDHS